MFTVYLYVHYVIYTIDTAILQKHELRIYCNEIETCTSNEIEITYSDIIIRSERSENVYCTPPRTIYSLFYT